MDGGFSATILEHLVSSGLPPQLVVHGLERSSRALGPVATRVSARSWLGQKKRSVASRLESPKSRDLERLSTDFGIDCLRTTDANSVRARDEIRAARADAFVVAGFPHLLGPAVLGLARKGGLNLHPGRLPEERGPSPLFWALREGRTRVAYTLHVLDEGEDSGDVVASGEIELVPGTDGDEILRSVAAAAAQDVVQSTRALLEGDLVRTPQHQEGVGRKPRPTFRDGRIDPSKSSTEVYTFVAGCARTHSIFLEVAGDRFFVARAESHDPEAKLTFEYVLTGDRLILRCNPGVVELVLKEDGVLFSSQHDER